ncbi:MAG: hypothetical protein ACKV2U_25770 [Bryobacteraceae bacterium]
MGAAPRLCATFALLAATAATPHIDRLSPLGGQAGTTTTIELVGKDLLGVTTIRFDTRDLTWLETTNQSATSIQGKIQIAANAALGPHRLQILTKNGPSNTRLFNVNQFPGVAEVEPNDRSPIAQRIVLRPQVLHGYMKGLVDVDYYTWDARAGERWLFDLQSIERGGFLECSLTLYDEAGNEIAFSEDQDEYLETPRLTYTFLTNGKYTAKVDQYRGPQGVSCDSNCGYQLQISQLPVIFSTNPLGGASGSKLVLQITGESLKDTREVYLTPIRGAEYSRLTFPFSIPLNTPEPQNIRIIGRPLAKTNGQIHAEFQIPPTASTGLWKLWAVTPHGIAEGISIEINRPEAKTIDGQLAQAGAANSYPIELEAGRPIHAWTLAAQLGLPSIDTVIELFDSNGNLLAEHDDLMSGQGTVIGNPDSNLYYTPKISGPAKLVVRDRTGRGGPSYVYRLHINEDTPHFQLLTEPEEFTVAQGSEADLEVLLIRQPGFDGAVEVWAENLPPGATATRGQFRSDQPFGPSGDGDNVLIPTANLKIQIPQALPPGEYPIRVFGRAANGGPQVEAFTTLWIGPNGKRNDTRRPLPRIQIHVTSP